MQLPIAFLALAISISTVESAIVTKHKPGSKVAAPPAAPWYLNNITIFEAGPHVRGASYIHFQFQDVRPNLTFTTDCRRFVLPDEMPGINDNATGLPYECANGGVQFQYNTGVFQLRRIYSNPSIGPPDNDHESAYGSVTATFQHNQGGCGRTGTQSSLPVQITAFVT